MTIRPRESHARSIVKGITWRMLGTIDTIVLSYIFTGNIKVAAAIGGTEVITKVGLYYLHERAWLLVSPEVSKKVYKFLGLKRFRKKKKNGDSDSTHPSHF